MGEASKQVRVDNWGIFFLQRLQLFFNRTDYCDLTLQFEGNVQLKVHRLVMNACTEYFNILEQTCEVVDGNTIIMPDDLQADVILPIVNFMYTGMLEFQMSIFEKLYRTADIMNIPILTKLLDAQKKPIPPLPKSQNKKAQPTWNLHGKKIIPKVENDLPATLPGRKLPVWKRKSIPTSTPTVPTTHYYSDVKKPLQDPLALFDNTPKPTRFEWPEDEISTTFNLMENSFDDISYTSKPLLTQDDELKASSSFDEVKYTPNLNKKSKDYSQSIDIEEVKNYVKEQKIRSDMTEYDDEDDPDNFLENVNIEKDGKRKAIKPMSPVNTKKVRFNVNEKENKEAKINVTTTGKAPEMDHTKIISEVLKKYPQLVKKNKNIRLKILAKIPTKIDVSKTQNVKTSTSKVKVQVTSPKTSPRAVKVSAGDLTKGQDEGPWVCTKCSSSEEQVEFVLYYLYRKHMTDVHNEKFDSRMCKFCGHQSSKHNMLMYHQYTRHGIKPPPAYNFPKCNRCPYIALTENLLIKHKLNHTKFDLQCLECKVAFNNQASLATHMQITGHTGKSGRHNYDCQYCTKRYHSGSNLFSHIKMVHRDEARRDGIVSIDEKDEIEDDQIEDDIEEYIVPSQEDDQKDKIKILSNIKVPVSGVESENQTQQSAAHQRVATTTSSVDNVTSSIATSLGLVDIVVLDENQQYILHNDQQLVTQQALTNEQREYIIPEMTEQHTFTQGQNINEVITSEHNVITQSILSNSDIASTDELVMVLTDHDYNDGNNEILSNENSNIVVLYSHPVDGQQNQFITSQGNLMLNSQTGMLEIRNNDNSQDAQIESIEMIQREINSHNIISTTENANTVSTSSSFGESLTQNTVILENQFSSNSELVQNKQQETETSVTVVSEDIDVDKMISLTDKRIKENMQEEITEEILIANDCLSNAQEEPMEIDEECGIDNDNENEIHDVVIQDTVPSEPQYDSGVENQSVTSKNMPEIDAVTQETISEPPIDSVNNDIAASDLSEITTEAIKESTDIVDNNNKDVEIDEKAGPSDSNTATENKEVFESNEVITETVAPEAQAFEQTVSEIQIEDSVNVVANETIEDRVQENTLNETNADKSQDENNENLSVNIEQLEQNKSDNEISSNVNKEQSTEELQNLITETPNTHETVAQEIDQKEENVNIEPQETNASTEECTVSYEHNVSEVRESRDDVQIHEEVLENVEEMTEIVEIDTQNIEESEEHQHEHQHIEEETLQIQEEVARTDDPTPQIEDVTHSEIEETTFPIEDVTTQTEEVTSQIYETTSQIDEATSQIDEATSQIDEVNSQIDENSIQNESADETFKDAQEETPQTDDKINLEEHMIEESISSADENSHSQDSQLSQCSSKPEEFINELKKTTSQATKISILNDWEDTEDSQQSDNVSKKAEITVNKLIHDWDDDDEEGHETVS